MTDTLTKKQRSFCMSRVRGKNTAKERIVRKAISSEGIRGYRLHYKLDGRPDVYVPRNKTAIFVDGCFWHKCPKCFEMPKTNRAFWRKKINSNLRRDKIVNRTLKKKGVRVLRIWEHELNDEHVIKHKIIQKLKIPR